jgi:hypothetical protein
MDRFPCESELRVTVKSTETKQTITVRLQHHQNHIPYFNVDLPAEAADLIRQNLRVATPNSLVGIVQEKFPQVSANQIYRCWATMSEALWKRADDQQESAETLLKELEEQGGIDRFEMEVEEGVTAVAWGLPEIASRVKGRVFEVAMDATCKQVPHPIANSQTKLEPPQITQIRRTLSCILSWERSTTWASL